MSDHIPDPIYDKKIPAKLEAVARRYTPFCFDAVEQLEGVEMAETKEHFRELPTGSDLKWRRVRSGDSWGGSWISGWFRIRTKLPTGCQSQQVYLRAATGAPEGLLIVDGEHRGVFDPNHPVVMLTGSGNTRRNYQIAVEAHAGHPCIGTQPDELDTSDHRRVFEGFELLLQREDVVAFVFDLQTLLQLAEALDEDSLRKSRILAGLADVWQTIDAMPAETEESSWRPKLHAARALMQPLLSARNGDSAPFIGIVGHSHIDTAWLWTIAETERKCARTFSSALNLIEQYPEFRFVQSSPYHAEIVRREYPGIFRRMQAAAADGSWEPNGAMWVEPDCNIPSGEAFVRQLLLGQQFTRQHFDYTADAFWQPDVFGYSAALPQILRKSGVDYFYTTKIAWNDTTRFPYDTFQWQGIDGTTVLSHFNKIHCFPDPKTLIDQWKDVQHKVTADRRLAAIGYGDGGGGPQFEMLEYARRVGDLEGVPRTAYTSISDFMRGIEAEGGQLPRWVGELYLELHRGTLTSIAEIKRLNRRCEEALHDAEFVWTLAALAHSNARRPKKYPAAILHQLWADFLVNQFHDILPGSSIPEVNDEAIEQMGRLLAQMRDLTNDGLGSLAAATRQGRDRSPALLVANTLGWDREGEICLTGVPAGMVPDRDGLVSQQITTVTGQRQLAIQGVTLPALGAIGLPMRNGRTKKEPSPFKVTERGVETPFARVGFDAHGRIRSLLDKASGRQLVSKGGVLNTFWIGEDVPAAWDNWDIDFDQQFKMQPDTRLQSREIVADGPLQLRIRSTYTVGKGSTLTQDLVVHSTTPRIDFDTVVDWHEQHMLLKAGFPLDVHVEAARHEIQFGHVLRPTHRNRPADRAQFEVVNHHWTDLSETGFGVAILNDGKYGISVDGSEARLTLLKSGLRPDPRGDDGRHTFTYALLPHACGFSAEAVILPSYEFNIPPMTRQVAADAPPTSSLLSVSAPNIVVEAIKWAEEGRALVLRLYEAERSGTHAEIRFGAPVKKVEETNMLEEQPTELPIQKERTQLYFRPFEIKTLKIAID